MPRPMAFGKLAAGQSSLFDPQSPHALKPVTESAAHAARVRRVSVWHLDEGADTLCCLDCYDRETEGHTSGARLLKLEHPGLFDTLLARTVFRTTDAAADPRLCVAASHYLAPLGCQALIGVPINAAERIVGALLLEDTVRRREWPEHTVGFAQALANLLAIRITNRAVSSGRQSRARRLWHRRPAATRRPARVEAAFRHIRH